MDAFEKFRNLILILALVRLSRCLQVLDGDFQALCLQRCPFQNKTEDHFDVGCGSECKIGQCSKGCLLWRKALESNCQTVCNGTQNLLSQKELHCVMGCNDAVNQYFQKLKDEIGTPPAPYLVADTLTATSLSLAWEGARYSEISYLVQWRYEEHAGAWQYCRNQSWGPSSVVLVENLQPYTKYRFRVALLLSPHSEPIVSEPSVVISTLAAGIPSSAPTIIRATAVDSKRISVSWKPGPFPNGPIHSYVLELVGDYVALKEDIPATKATDFYMFQNLSPNSKYVVSISMRNAVGEGPSATAEVLTPPEPTVKDTPQPILILGSKHRVIKQGADMMLDAPVVIYETSRLITGVGIHVSKNLLFVSDADGFVSVSSLRKFSEPKYLLAPYDLTFKPLDLSVDWLNQHLYVLGEVAHNQASLWQVARCSLEGKGLTVAVAGLTVKPLHIEVDPYNGYLFWLIQGHNRGGLYRLDLANISNGIKHEVIPDVILEDPSLGAFVVDHINFCILVPNHAKNTVYSVSLDGREVTDLRSNTQQPLFQNVLSLAIANGLFYWTNGEEVLTEDYHEEYHTYFHNHYLGSKNRSYVSVHVDLPTSQPVPVPVNPPIHVQAVLGGRVAKVSWQTPHIVGGQGKGAWQNWSYELHIKNERTGTARTHREIVNTTSHTVEGLDDNTEYVIKAAAYTSSGNGPWSTEFRGKTIRTPANGRFPSLIWSAAEGLLESDVTGDEVETLLSQENLKDGNGEYHFVEISWYRDKLYLVTNTSKVHWYNMTSHEYGQIHNLESVGSIAVDWIGKKLYWSNPKQQLIIRGDLSGFYPEPLLILTIAKELNIDSEEAFIYWSTGHAVECARLNGDARRVYYPAELFSGKQVMGLALNMDDRHVYWIVRSNEGSNLFKAPMARSSAVMEGELEPTKISSLQHSNMQGPLCYFADHLLWLQDNRNAIIGDLFGQNAAIVSGMSLSGLKTVTVLDWDSRSHLEEEVRVIPEPIDEGSIRVIGTSTAFNITWDPVVNVNFGQVFYDVKTEDYSREKLVKLVENELIYDRARELLPYTEIKVTLQAFTYWGSSPRVAKTIHSPPSTPGTPTNPRVFVNSRANAEGGKEADALLRWHPPAHPNGIITAYRIRYFCRSEGVRQFSHVYLLPNELEWTLENLLENATYVFQIQAFTVAGEGEFTKPMEINSSFIIPVPTLLVVTKDSIKLMDCDSEAHKTLSTGDKPTDVTLNSHEGWIYWLNDLQEIVGMKLDGTGRTKILVLNGTGLSLAVDWVGRFLYWSELEEKDSVTWCSIKRLDLTQTESGFSQPERVVKRSGRIEDLEVSPFSSTLYWVEVNHQGGGHLMLSRVDGRALRPLFAPRADRFGRECTCPENPRIGKALAIDQTDPYNVVIIYSDEWQGHVYKTGSAGCDCSVMARFSTFSPTSITTDHRYLYWLNETEDAVFILKQDSEVQTFAVESARKITAVGSHLQPFPPSECLSGQEYSRAPRLLERTATSILLELDKPETLPKCENISLPSVRYVIYYDVVDDIGASECMENLSSCKSILSYRSPVKIDNLKPFSRYVFMVSLRNHFGNGSSTGPSVVFSTLAGAPPPPQNLTVTVLSPAVLEVTWASSRKFPFNAVWYQVHWRSEEVILGVRQSGEQILENFDPQNPVFHRVMVHNLLPGQTYLIWVRAYSKLSSAYSESEKVEVETFSQPGNITLVHATPYSLEIAWKPPHNIFHRFSIQFRHFPGFETWENVSFVNNNVNNNDDDDDENVHYLVKNLSPKSSYRFRVVIVYVKSKPPYIWPEDGFEFETLGDRPSRPGTPVIQQLRKDVYQVLWEKSRDNGAVIDYYALEGLVRRIWRRKRETYYNGSLDDSNKSASEQWTLYYNGTENYWIINELSPSLKYIFRVKAKNHFGWSDFSETSKSFDFTEAAMLASQEELSVVLGTTVPLLFLCCLVVLAIFCCVTKMREKEKKDLQILNLATTNRGPDVELATLRELPRRGNFIHNANILYSTSGPLVDEEFSLLPHVRREQFKLTKFLGSGAFGEVYEGVAQDLPPGASDVRVAIKALRKGATDHEKTEFLKEALLMSHFKHEHILQLLGVCLDNDPNYILMELMEGGDLLSYLRTNRPLVNTSNGLTLRDLLEMCLDVTKGCRYLEEMHFVHRDLACRNCLVSSTDPRTRIVKIGDFGLARDIYKNDYYRKEGEGLLPVRWMAPESLVDGVFTSQSDVWAFGVLIWEIMTLGQQPYPARTNLEVLHYVRSGGRLGKPNNCSDKLHQLMMKCWSFNPESRPTFKYCLEVFKDLKEGTENAALSTDYGENYLEARPEGREDEEEAGAESDDNESNSGARRKPGGSEPGSAASELETESSSVASGDPHQYLELLRGDEVQGSDGYEVPSLGNGAEDERTSEGNSSWQTLTTAVMGLMTDSDAGRVDEYPAGAGQNASFVASVFGAPSCLRWEPVNHVYFQLANTFFFLSYLAPNGMYGILYLRCTLLVSCAFFALWGWAVLCSFDAFLWNSTFVVINFVQVCVLIYHLRPVKFTREVEEVYAALFRPLKVSRHQFKKVLNCMKLIRQLKYQEVYAQERGTKVDSLSLVLSGKLVVSQNGRALHIVFPHQFLDSPEWFGVPTDDFFQVSITAMEESRVLIWHRDKLKLSIITDQFLQAVFDHILGRDVVKKLMQVSETMAATNGHLPNMEDGEDKPMLVIKKPGDTPGITALINRQFQGMPRMRYYYCASDPNTWRLGRIEETDHETPV